MRFIGVEVEQETSAHPPKTNPAFARGPLFTHKNSEFGRSFCKEATLRCVDF